MASQKESREYGKADATISRWTLDLLSLLVSLTFRGVQRIRYDTDHIPGQQFFWEGIEEKLPELETSKPFGPRLAHELSQAMSGRPVESRVPWVAKCPRWQVELFEHVRRLPPGRTTEIPGSLQLGGKYRDRKKVASALRTCPFVPLVPTHRLSTVGNQSVRFPWGESWRRYLLQQERRAWEEGEAG